MANKVTEGDKIEINELYLKFKTYAEVARQTGFSASTVKKYIIPNYVSKTEIIITPFAGTVLDEVPVFSKDALTLSPQEQYNLELLKKELVL